MKNEPAIVAVEYGDTNQDHPGIGVNRQKENTGLKLVETYTGGKQAKIVKWPKAWDSKAGDPDKENKITVVDYHSGKKTLNPQKEG